VFPVGESLALLARTGIEGPLTRVALYAAAALDIGLGVAMLALRRRRWVYRAQLLLIAGYTATISVFLPEYWAHPYGPILKNLPVLAAIAVLHELDDAHGPADR
jgi:DoxX-like family